MKLFARECPCALPDDTNSWIKMKITMIEKPEDIKKRLAAVRTVGYLPLDGSPGEIVELRNGENCAGTVAAKKVIAAIRKTAAENRILCRGLTALNPSGPRPTLMRAHDECEIPRIVLRQSPLQGPKYNLPKKRPRDNDDMEKNLMERRIARKRQKRGEPPTGIMSAPLYV